MTQNTWDAREVVDERIEGIDWSGQRLDGRAFDSCHLSECDLSDAWLVGTRFLECTFVRCNLSNCRVEGAAMRGVQFKECKAVGVAFSRVDPLMLDLGFEDCDLSYCDFNELDLSRSALEGCTLVGSLFERTNLWGARLGGCELRDARFDACNLEKADFRGSSGCSLDPSRNRVRGTRFDPVSATGLLRCFGIRFD